ncbi:MAG TPA: tetratricopeptide repeat protein [Methyloceanibacter sp.]|nr:tetratricopeptide repeat protein [Methyloceanibacter sp.]
MDASGHRIGWILAALVAAGLGSEALAEDATLLRAREGAAALMRGQFDRAIASYDEALQATEIADFIKASIYSDRGVAKWRLNQTKEAIEDFNQAIQLSPENGAVYNNRGNALMDLGHPDEALKDFDRAIALSQNYGVAYNNRGNARVALGQYDLAFHDFRKAVELMPRSGVPFNGRGKAHAALKRYHAAVRDLSRAIGIDPRYAAAYQHRAEAYFQLGMYREAIADATQVLTLEPDTPNPDVLLLRGRAYAKDKKLNPALEDLNKAIELKPELVDAYVERGIVFIEARRFDDAIGDFNRAIELDAKNARAYAMRASTKLQGVGNSSNALENWEIYDQALGDINQALQIAADDPQFLRIRGNVYEALNRTDEGIADYRKALALDQSESESRAALERLGIEVPEPQTRVLGEPVAGWEITEPQPGRYVASNAKYPALKPELEMFGTGEPKIIEWKLLKDALSGIGLLKYYAGDFGDEEESSLEYVAILDTRANKVVSIEPQRWGSATAQWNWQAVSVVVTDPDGNANEVQLRAVRQKAAPTRRSNDFWGFGATAEGEPQNRRAARRGQSGGGGESGGPGIFNWLFR